MPTILLIRGWRFFFYHNERNEPPHIHVRKGGVDCKNWLNREEFDVSAAFEYNASPADRRAVRRIIFEHFDYIISEYERFHKGID
jgi:hypothetical protein